MESTKIQRLEEEIKLFPYLDLFPELGKNVFLAPGCKLIGDVKLGDDSSVWYNCVLRGDVHYIKIGYLTNVQDCSMIHVTNKKYPVNIGNKVTIGHSVTLHVRDRPLLMAAKREVWPKSFSDFAETNRVNRFSRFPNEIRCHR